MTKIEPYFCRKLDGEIKKVAGMYEMNKKKTIREHFEELPSIGYAMQMFSVHNYTTLIAEVYQYFA